MKRAERFDGLAGFAGSSIIGKGGVRYRRLLKVLIESGGMYCLTWLILLCLNATRSSASHIFFSIIGQLTVRHSLQVPPTTNRNRFADLRTLFYLPGAVGDIPDADHRARVAESGSGPRSGTCDRHGVKICINQCTAIHHMYSRAQFLPATHRGLERRRP